MGKKRKRTSRDADRAARRKAFFEENGDPSQWRPRSTYFEDEKKEKDKNKCRGKHGYRNKNDYDY